MAIQKFTGKIDGIPTLAKTNTTERPVVHVWVNFIPEVKLDGKLPELGENPVCRIRFSIWEQKFQESIMADAGSLNGRMITGYCDNVIQRDQYYNGTCYAFVLSSDKAKPCAPQLQTIGSSSASKAPSAPVAPAVPA